VQIPFLEAIQRMSRTVAFVGLACTLVAATAAAQPRMRDVKIRGYVTEVRSSTSFDIEDYRISRDEGFALDFENASPEITFSLNDVRVGVELEVRGQLNEETGELKAKSIRVDLEQFKPLKQTAIVSARPEGIELLDGSWAGELKADGQVIRVTRATKVLFKPTKREQKLAERKQKEQALSEAEAEEGFERLNSLDQVTVGMSMTYEGKRDRETGRILAERIEFTNNDLEDGEAKLWKSLKTTVKTAEGLKPGELKIDKIGKFKLLPSREVQDYVAAIGRSLIPPYQADLGADDPRRIPFQFHVVVDDVPNAFATPNGIVIVHSGLIELLDNEAQLAAVLGHEIVHSTHEHTWRAQQYHKKKRFAIGLAGAVAAAYGLNDLADIADLVNAALVNGHSRSLENQSDRVGLEYMVKAGYDPREAPAVWKLMAKKNGVHATNFFWSTHENQATRRSYLMNELKNNYRDLDYSLLKVNADAFSRMKAQVVDAKNRKRKLKVS
jgi:Peptidase family M48/Domain of unknown function (DUF5666)